MTENSPGLWNFSLNRKGLLVSQIRQEIKRLIREGKLQPGDKMPSIIDLAARLGVSKKTVHCAYDDLKATGMLVSRLTVGTYVCSEAIRPCQGKPPQASYKYNRPLPLDYPPRLTVSFLKLGSNSARMVVDPIAKKFRKHNISGEVSEPMSGYRCAEAFVDSVLEILSDRNIQVAKSQLCITSGVGRNLSAVVITLLNQKDYVVISSPYDKTAIASFNLVNAEICFTGADEEGMNTDRLEKLCIAHPVKAVFIRPSEEYPTCASISLARRERIVELSIRYGFVIIEMYKEHEFLPVNEPLTFWEMGHHERVIYLGTVSRMDQRFNAMGIVAAAPDFISQLRLKVRQFTKEDHSSNKTLVKLVEEEHFRLICAQMMKVHLKLKRDIFILVDNYFRDKASLTFSEGGWAVWIRLHKEIDPSPIIPELRELGLCHHPSENEHCGSISAILLGYGDHNVVVLEKAMKLVSELYSRTVLMLVAPVLAICYVDQLL